jgi:protein kinase A
MLMGLVQGGELYAIMHTVRRDGIPENKAKFYCSGIAEGLAYIHRRGFVYRDLKPENVLLDDKGYPVIVDFGFAKLVTDKTYTLCGTPLYLAPEVILNRGHNGSADNWSLGVLIYEMITGSTPFYRGGMDQTQLFKAIIRGKFQIPSRVSAEASDMISALLVKDPTLRLGSLAGGESDIINHPFLDAIDKERLRRRELTAPFVPKIKDPLDASNFEDWSHLEDKTKAAFPALSREKEAIFEKF